MTVCNILLEVAKNRNTRERGTTSPARAPRPGKTPYTLPTPLPPPRYILQNQGKTAGKTVLPPMAPLRDICGRLPLHVAAQAGHLAVFQLIFDAAEEKNPKDDEGATPYSLALENGHHEIVGVIEKWQACRKQRGRRGRCPTVFGRSAIPISNRGDTLTPPSITFPSGFSDLSQVPGPVRHMPPNIEQIFNTSITCPSSFSDFATAQNGN